MTEKATCSCGNQSKAIDIGSSEIIKFMFAPSCIAIIFCITMTPAGGLLGFTLLSSALLAIASLLTSMKHIYSVFGVIQSVLFALFNTLFIQCLYYYVRTSDINILTKNHVILNGGIEPTIIMALTMFSLGIFTISFMHKAPILRRKLSPIVALSTLCVASLVGSHYFAIEANRYVVHEGIDKLLVIERQRLDEIEFTSMKLEVDALKRRVELNKKIEDIERAMKIESGKANKRLEANEPK